jgi:hypothetical protein
MPCMLGNPMHVPTVQLWYGFGTAPPHLRERSHIGMHRVSVTFKGPTSQVHCAEKAVWRMTDMRLGGAGIIFLILIVVLVGLIA